MFYLHTNLLIVTYILHIKSLIRVNWIATEICFIASAAWTIFTSVGTENVYEQTYECSSMETSELI